ncbi:MAG: glycosyltransferase [Sedimentisphaerales bacterium]
MRKKETQTDKRTLLVFNCHESWVHQLGVLGYKLDIIIGLKGQYLQTWDEQMRPIPPNSRLITLPEAKQSKTHYYCIITHNITDLLDIKQRPEPRLLVIHSTIEGRALEERSDITPQNMKETLNKYLKLIGGHAVAISMLKGKSWGFTKDIVPCAVNADDYLPYSGQTCSGLRVCNFIESRKKILLWDLYQKAFDGIPVRLVGHNPNMRGVGAANSWDHLKRILQSHRFYIHTANPELEDGYNMASLEAMAAGLPVLGNRHPTSLIEHGVSGFLSDDPAELRKYANMLLEDKILATMMGREARKTVIERFSMNMFKEAFLQSIEMARQKWGHRKYHL